MGVCKLNLGGSVMNTVELITAILAGLATAIPLIISLVKYVKESVKQKNWSHLLNLVMNLMQEAEKKFEDGATKKEYVLALVKSSADTINYDIDIDAVGNLIDSLCDMANVVNAPMQESK